MSSEILALYDATVRCRGEVNPQFRYEWDGPVHRMVGPDPVPYSNSVLYARLDASSADEMIAR